MGRILCIIASNTEAEPTYKVTIHIIVNPSIFKSYRRNDLSLKKLALWPIAKVFTTLLSCR